jgi:hypothetical protein
MLARVVEPTNARGCLDSSIFLKIGPPPIPADVPDRDFIVYDRATESLKCSICDTTHYDVDGFIWHTQGKRHIKNRGWKEFDDLDNDPSLARMGDPDRGVPPEIECRGVSWFKCSLCDCQLWEAETARQHCAGRRHRDLLVKHQRNIAARRIYNPIAIPVCSSQAQAHREEGLSVLKARTGLKTTGSDRPPCIYDEWNSSSRRILAEPPVKQIQNDLGLQTKVFQPSYNPYFDETSSNVDKGELGNLLPSKHRLRLIPPPPNYDPRQAKRP